uniref:V2 n=1 Tax=Euphorbia caput-medusae latent virus TaxID=1853865 RepID=A0A166V4F4_9GEMI|nr:V2 [Euphorbia caput-medusae latent virus]ANA76348.1 V2 [Euphorbia caput-medusae latent virus]
MFSKRSLGQPSTVYGILCLLDFLVAEYFINFYFFIYYIYKWKNVSTSQKNFRIRTGSYRASAQNTSWA